MSKKNRKYGFPYNYDHLTPLHKFVNTKLNKVFLFYKDGNNLFAVEKADSVQQRVMLNETSFNNLLGALDKHGWTEVKV
jgi:hypothetical protein